MSLHRKRGPRPRTRLLARPVAGFAAGRIRLGLVVLAILLGALPGLAVGTASAAALEFVPPRVLGMGNAGRANASSTAAPALNPSGLSLLRSYVVEGAYQYLSDQQGHIAHVAIADSTSNSNVGAGLSYTYANAAPEGTYEGAEKMSRHEGRLSLSFPFNDHIAIGATGRYLRLARTLPGAAEENRSGITYDAGITVRPISRVAIGFVGYGLRDMKDPQAPFGYGGGLAVLPLPDLVLVADTAVDLRTYVPEGGDRRKAVTISGGAEYTLASRFVVRGGGGRDGVRRSGFGSLGVAALSETGSLDFSGRLDFGGGEKTWIMGVSLRLFVPAP